MLPFVNVLPSVVVYFPLGTTLPFSCAFATEFSTALPYNSILLFILDSLLSSIISSTIGVAISAIIANITITAKSSIRVNPLL